MDTLSGLLTGPHARGAFLVRSVLNPPWSIRIQDEAPLTLIAVLRGEAWLMSRQEHPVALRPGSVAIVRGPDHYTVADDPARPPTVVIHPGQYSTTVEGAELCDVMTLGPRTWGDSPTGSMTMLTGTYQTPSEISRLLLAALPAVIVIPDDAWDCRFLTLLNDELSKPDAGQEVVLDRLLDLVLVEALRSWLASTPPGQPHPDPLVDNAIQLMHDAPSRRWTVASLADAVGISRAALARRFTDRVGKAPMAYLTEWRLALAADLLTEPAATIESVAHRVGYGGAFALSTAFKRVRGVSPHEYRMALAGR
jgi:AraC-like DNA-binding protein